METLQLVEKIAELATEKKGFDIKIVNLSQKDLLFDYFVIISGNVDQHLKAISEFIRKELSKFKIKPIGYEGQSNSKWIILDYGEVIVHIFDSATREIYQLEKLWNDAEVKEYQG